MMSQAPNGIVKIIVEACAALCVGLLGGVLTVVSQFILNKTIVSWPHATLIPMSAESASFQVDADITIPGPFGAVLDPYTATLSTMISDPAGRMIKTSFGESTFPKLSLKHGANPVDFKMPVNVHNEDVMLKHFINPMFVEGKQVQLFVDVDALTMHILGFIPLPGKKMHKVLECNKAALTSRKLQNAVSTLQLMATNHSSYAMQCFHAKAGQDVVV